MKDDVKLREMVDKDILHCDKVWKEYSHDREQMETLFYKLLYTYVDKIDNLLDGLSVVSTYDKSVRMADIYRENVKRLIHRLKLFRDNGYTNEGLLERCLASEDLGVDIHDFSMDFNEARLYMMNLEGVSQGQIAEIINKIDEIEEICIMIDTKKKKWDRLRPYLIWVSGKEAHIALRILPLFLKINQ